MENANGTTIEANRVRWADAPGTVEIFHGYPEGTREWYEEVDAWRFRFEPYYEPYLKRFAPPPGENVLEIGCGIGTASRWFARHGNVVTSFDLVPSNVKTTRRGYTECGLSGEVVEGNAECLPFGDNTFTHVHSH